MTAQLVPHYLIAKAFQDQTPEQIKRACKRAGVPYMTARSWITDRRAARIDLFCKVANAFGYEVVLIRPLPPIEPEKQAMRHHRQPSTTAATSKLRLIDRNGRTEVIDSAGKLAGYVSEEMLYAIDKDGYAASVGAINHRVEIIGKLENWRNGKPSAAA